MTKVLLSAFACDPTQGSEPGYGWNWALGLARKGFEVHCITREISKPNIEKSSRPENLHFHYIRLPFGFENLYSFSQPGMYLYYLIWQMLALKKAKSLHKIFIFDIAHHVTWGSIQLGSFLYNLHVPFVFGPAGGGQFSPTAFRKYFGKNWIVEERREKVSTFLLKYSPACKTMIKKASAIWVSNPETAALVSKIKSSNVFNTLDVALPSDFFPQEFYPKIIQPGKLRLLWVGRFMPRKGAILLLDVMQKLKNFTGISLTMIGDGEERPSFLDAVIEKDLQNSVFWKGKVAFDEIKNIYANHDVFFFTSLRDSGGVQLVEAMAYGLPVVTLNLHGQRIIVNDETGIRCACDSPEQAIEELTNAILKLYHDPALVTKMSKAAYRFALKQVWDEKINNIVENSYPI